MDHQSLSITGRHQEKKIFLPGGPLSDPGKPPSKCKNRNRRISDGGFFEIEMLSWVSIMFLILLGYFSIYKTYRNEHQKVQEDFQRERSQLKLKR